MSSFREALYGNSTLCSFGNLDGFLNDMINLREAVAELCDKQRELEKDVVADNEQDQRIRVLLEIPDDVGLVDGVVASVKQRRDEENATAERLIHLSRALSGFALFGETAYKDEEPSGEPCSGTDGEGREISLKFADFHEAAKALRKHGRGDW